MAGSVVELGSVRITEAAIIRFATEFDPLPIHLDRVAANCGPFGGIIASGIHTLALYQRLQSSWLRQVAVVAGRGCDRMRLPNPVRPGDVLSAATRIACVAHQDAGRSLLTIHSTMRSETGIVLDLHAGIVVRRRQPPHERGSP